MDSSRSQPQWAYSSTRNVGKDESAGKDFRRLPLAHNPAELVV